MFGLVRMGIGVGVGAEGGGVRGEAQRRTLS